MLTEIINTLFDYTNECDLTVNTNKTKIVVFKNE